MEFLATMIGYPALALLVGLLAQRRGRSGAVWAIAAIVVSAPVALLLLLAADRGPFGVADAAGLILGGLVILANLM